MPVQYIFLGLILAAGILYAVMMKKLTLAAALTGAVVAICIYSGMGFTGVGMMTAFFILGSAATSWKKELKKTINGEIYQAHRTTLQVLANSGVAAIAALSIYYYPADTALFRLIIAAAFASATADTLSSELGTVYGRRFYNIITLKKDERGLDGVISIEGLLIGIAGSTIIALIYGLGYGFNYTLVIVFAGTIGNIADSVLGATLERKEMLANNEVNFLNTMIAAAVVVVFV
ncbi:MAG: DUF92 domain-containing protein [Sphingobacteriales bacterium]|nr:MAG: DUF92 domain-containing protein [Sphingobacteriales bacterium]